MKILKICEALEKLFSKWGLSSDHWCLLGEHSLNLLGYKIKPKKGREKHIDIFVNGKKLPWKVPPHTESTIPPVRSKYFKEFIRFIKKNKVDLHVLPLPIGPSTPKVIVEETTLFPLKNKKKIRLYTPYAEVRHRHEHLFHPSYYRTWDKEKTFRWLWFFETVRKIAQKKKDRKVISACNKAVKDWKKVIKEFSQKELESKTSKILKGKGAYLGKVKGKVRVIRKFSELKKLKKGEILVTPMTTTRYLPQIKKAKGIITDRGGVLSHAAVISREFKIPCIVNTKVSTKTLYNGDEVLMDSKKGIIKKL